ncbi:MAG: hypothetical protein IPL86_16850 [Flavobacteriales bacterium]|nr:hypothetical protein [Flavobacteriales bacterium]
MCGILIDGKPSILADGQGNALGTITADMIESVEVITNPSAKYDAAGTAGILNIVLKKEEQKGLNGSVSLNTGSPDNHSVGFSLNRRTNKFNLFARWGSATAPCPGLRRPSTRTGTAAPPLPARALHTATRISTTSPSVPTTTSTPGTC